jgi:hypothetical protein
VADRIERCRPIVRPTRELFDWPAPSELVQNLACELRPPAEEGRVVHRWLTLREHQLAIWQSEVTTEGAEDLIDLSRPFSLTASAQPPAAGDDALTTLNLTLVQTTGAETRTVSFGVPARSGCLDPSLPRQDQRLARLGPRDVEPVLAALAFHAQALGVPLPRCAA